MPETLTFWGTRGSIPTPGPHTARYGGNTPCLSVAGSNGHVLILDAGSGIRPLGQELARRAAGGGVHADIVLSHTHWDHIQGLPFFRPLMVPGNAVTIHGPSQQGFPLAEILGRQMDPVVFPVPLRALGADITIREIAEQRVELDRYGIEAFRLRHPGTTLGFRVAPRSGGREFAYVTDNELGAGGNYDVGENWRVRLADRLRGVDTLIHDAMYTDDLIATRAGWGHSTAHEAVALAAESGARRLVLFHHEPEHSDDALDRILAGARELARRTAPGLVVDTAIEGMTIQL